MKKMILLLMLPLTALMAIEFVMTRDGLVDAENFETTTPTQPGVTAPVPSTPSTYLETVNLPACDASNPEVHFINNNSDWSKINDSSKRIFCVSPGDYTALGNIRLTRSGTDAKRRYIVLNNGNDTHPGKLNKNQLANFALDLDGASYWILDRIASFDISFSHSFILRNGSSYNIFNRMFTQNIYHTMWIRDKAHYNTIQNSRFDGITDDGAAADLSTINIAEWGDDIKYFTVFGTKILNNEFVDVKAARCNRFPAEHLPSGISQVAYFDGTIFDNNIIATSQKKRTDCQGNFTPNGQCVAFEAGALSFKAGSENPNNPIIVSNNHAWGLKKSDPTYKNLSSPGDFSLAYMGAKNIIYDNNVIFDSTNGIRFADPYDMPYGSKNIIIKNNLIFNSGQDGTRPMVMSLGVDNIVKDNVIIQSEGAWADIWINTNLFCGNNTIINAGDLNVIRSGYTPNGFETNKIFQTTTQAGYTKDYTFTTDKYTNNPRVITLPNAVKAN